MALKRTDMPLVTFDSRYHDIIVAGTKDRIEIRQSTKREATRLRHLLTTYRARYRDHCKKNDDPSWEVLYNATIGTSEDGFSTVVRPRSEEATSLLRNITITSSNDGEASLELPSDPLAEFDEKK